MLLEIQIMGATLGSGEVLIRPLAADYRSSEGSNPSVPTNLWNTMKNSDSEIEIIPLDLSIEEIGRLAILAHEADMKLNDYIIKIILEYIDEKSGVSNEQK